jgi:hypothetical protein
MGESSKVLCGVLWSGVVRVVMSGLPNKLPALNVACKSCKRTDFGAKAVTPVASARPLFYRLNNITMRTYVFIFIRQVLPNGGCAGPLRCRDAPQTPRSRHAPARQPAMLCRQ